MSAPAPLAWNNSMLTGIDEIDRQHRILVDTLIEAGEKLTDNPNDPLFEQLTRDLLAYAIYHFDTEEKLMREHDFASRAPEEAAAHLGQHRRFSEQVIEMRREAKAGHSGAREALLDFLQSWLINHIMSSDRQLGRFLLSSQAQTPGNE